MRVFISGVSRTFASHREKIAKQLRKLRIEPVQQEEFTATSATISDMLRKKVRSCDAVICLVGPAYGFAPHEKDIQPPRSYTQLEYYFARELNKKIYYFTPDKNCPVDAPPQDNDDELSWQKSFLMSLRQAGRQLNEYRNIDHLLVLVTEALRETADFVVQAPILMQYPTPLAQLYEECFDAEDQQHDAVGCANLLAGTLRLLSLLAAQDAVAAESFGTGCADVEAIVNECVVDEIEMDVWLRLLWLACAAGQAGGRGD